MKTHPKEILLYYNPYKKDDKKTPSYTKSLLKHNQHSARNKSKRSPTVWRVLLKSLHLKSKNLFNKTHPA
jgi:hypothetical protein